MFEPVEIDQATAQSLGRAWASMYLNNPKFHALVRALAQTILSGDATALELLAAVPAADAVVRRCREMAALKEETRPTGHA